MTHPKEDQHFSEAATPFFVQRGASSGHLPVGGDEGGKTEFREALIEHIAQSGVTSAAIAAQTGVSKDQIDKLRQRRVEATNVSDAMKLAAFFGKTVEEFCAGPSASRDGGKKMQALSSGLHGPQKTDDHPLWGWAQGTVVVMPGTDLTDSVYSDAEMDEFLDDTATLIESGLKS